MKVRRVFAERFELEIEIGAGGMGTVYRARDASTGTPVAVKVLSRVDADDRRRFAREVSILAELHHPGIVRYIAHGETAGGEPYLAMEWLEGEDLAARLARGRLGVVEAAALGVAVARALEVAHARGVIHRDIKPANLFLVGCDLTQLKLLDFGIARASGGPGTITRTGATVGTPAYMAPEQARGDPHLDGRVDVFALGCVLFECLAGQPPFAAAHPLAVMAKILFEDAPWLGGLRAEVPAALEAAIESMLAKDPASRPRDAAAVAAALLALPLGEEPPPATRRGPPPSPSSLSDHEQRLVCVILSGPPRAASPGVPPAASEAATLPTPPTAPTMASPRARGDELNAIAARFGARLELLRGGEVALVLLAAATAADLTARAARCALAVRRLLPELPLALATGRGEIACAMPVGEAIDRAVALLREGGGQAQGTAAPIRLDEVTAGLLGERFEVRGDDRGLHLAGEDASSFWVERRLLGRPTACVGRERELAALGAILDECLAEPVARAVLVTGPPGIGKSRLCQEFLRRVERRGQPVAIWRGRGDAMSAGSPLGILGGALRDALGLSAAEPIEARRARLVARVVRHFAGKDLLRVAAFLGELVGTPFPDGDHPQLLASRRDPILLGDQMLRAFQDFVSAETTDSPVLIVLEDLHWGDQATVRFIASILRLLGDRALMVLAIARPGVTQLFPRLWQDRSLQEISLPGLTRRAAEGLVHHALGDKVDEDTVAEIVAHAEGNPFFLEELIRAVAEGKGRRFPETVVATVQVRLEALEEEPRRLLRAASVFGEAFCGGGVLALVGGEGGRVDAWLATLEERELISRLEREQFAGEVSYAFRHDLVRDAAYRTLTDPDRRLGHRLAAAWLARTGVQDGLLLAEHFERGDDLEAATIWYERAAEQALEVNDLAAVLARVARGMACGARGEAAGRLHVLAATAHNWLEAPKEAYQEASAGLELLPRGSTPWYAAVERLAWASGVLADVDQIEALARALGREGSPLIAVEAMHARLSVITWLYIFDRRAIAAPLATSLDGLDPEALEPAIAAHLYALNGFIANYYLQAERGVSLYDATVRAYERAGDLKSACLWRGNLGASLLTAGAHSRAEEVLSQALLEAERLGITYASVGAKKVLAFSLAERGALERAHSMALDVITASKQHGNLDNEIWGRLVLARVFLAGGTFEQALEQAQTAARITACRLPQHAIAAAILAQVFLRTGRTAEALVAATEAMEPLRSLGSIEVYEAFVRLTFAEVLHATGDPGAARAALATARDRLLSRADEIRAPDLRRSFLEAIPDHARTLALADAWGLPGLAEP